ncbi:hypothetical protein [Rhizobium sp. EC-SD404]|uniref:hypothetical protein n=1 Tax=Rhizobium sp. EC-SD404 TaxID=2038389 RepID=UPI001258E1DC|nr:hypothetical protein [Rhizobium sp. EC-SD404]VVT22885.1 conserved exported hypothetical protein [Rhizobium sp. EC-SD404]
MGMKHRIAAAIVSAAAFVAPAQAADQAFFSNVAGVWNGPGEIVAGKYQGTKFNCSLMGNPVADAEAGIALDGSCRVGVFSQKMSAVIRKVSGDYEGSFLDGAAGEGLDITAGRIDGDRVLMAIERKQLEGAMVARMMDANTMNVTVSVKVGDSMVPVIGMTLARDLDNMAVGSVQ